MSFRRRDIAPARKCAHGMAGMASWLRSRVALSLRRAVGAAHR
jgi:hypothetical protein